MSEWVGRKWWERKKEGWTNRAEEFGVDKMDDRTKFFFFHDPSVLRPEYLVIFYL